MFHVTVHTPCACTEQTYQENEVTATIGSISDLRLMTE